MAYGEMQTQFAGQYTVMMAHPTLVNARMTVALTASYNSEADGDQMVQDLVDLAGAAGWNVYNGKKVVPAYEVLTPDTV